MSLGNYLRDIGVPANAYLDYDKISSVLYKQFKSCKDAKGSGFFAPKYDCLGLVLPVLSETPLTDPAYYSYDTVAAICFAFNHYIDKVAIGYDSTPEKAPPASLSKFNVVFYTEYVREATHLSVKTTKPSSPDQIESEFSNKFYTALGTFIYNIYKDA